ncbi:MAG: NfeD family protein [Pseudomonadota bacterium]
MDVVGWLDSLEFWHWMVFGVALLVIELGIVGTVFLLWLAAAAIITGLGLLVAPNLAWQFQVLLFSVVAVVTLLATRAWLKRRPIQTDRPALNRRGTAYIGRRFTLSRPIENGRGELTIDDTLWRIAGPDLPAGAEVEVSDVEGTRLRVAAAGGG